MTTNKDIEGIIKDNPELQIELLKDMLDDVKSDRKRKHTLIVLLVVLLFSAFMYYEYSFKSFLSQYNLNSETNIKMDTSNSTHTNNNGNIKIGK